MDQEIRKGIKTFFLNADTSVTPDDEQLQGFFGSGFEVYPLPETRLIPIQDQIDCLRSLFHELIVFINVDKPPPEGTWLGLADTLRQTYGERVRIGIFHHENDVARRSLIERGFLLEARVQAGCIYVRPSQAPDVGRLHQILVANQANGRRKAIRMLCTGRLNFVHSKTRLEAKVIELSVSHFLCVFRDRDPNIAEGTRLHDLQLIVGGPVIHTDAVVMIKRASANGSEMVYVCGFVEPGTTNLGLRPWEKAGVLKVIHTYCTARVLELIQTSFQKRRQQRVLVSER